jgi:hypothetical protein
MDALQFFPTDADMLELAKGRAFLVKKDIFKNLMWYTMADSNKHYPLTLETVKRIKAQNREGIKPEELETAEIQSSKPKEVEPEYADLVGQISLKSLEKTTRRRRDKERGQQQGVQQRQQPGDQQNRNQQRPQQGAPQRNQPNAGPNRGPQQGNRGPQGGRPQGNRNAGPQRPPQQRPPQGEK